MKLKNKSAFGLYTLALTRLQELENFPGKVIPFPQVFEKLCSTFSITKDQCLELLLLFKELGWIEIIPYHGVKLTKVNI